MHFLLAPTAGFILTGKKRPSRSPVSTSNCTACGDCGKICPRGGVKIINVIAKIDYSICKRCYCCHEICSDNGIELKVLR